MVSDSVRNAAYSRAIDDAINPDCTVLDLGAGLGIHGLMAVMKGARKTYLVDPVTVVRHASDIARQNGLGDRVEVIRGRIEEIELPEKVDLIVAVLTGNFLLTEDLLPYLFHARDRFLKPGGRLIPGRARMRAVPVSAADLHAEHVSCWSKPVCGLSFEPVRKYAANTVFYAKPATVTATPLAEPVTLAEFDFSKVSTAECKCHVDLQVNRSGACHGILGWFDILLGDTWLSTGPEAEPTHWSSAFLPLDPPMELESGEAIRFRLDRPEFGEWTWAVEKNGEVRRHSTFYSQQADLEHLKSQSDSFVPGLSERGELVQFVLQQMAAGRSTGSILTAASARFSQRHMLPGQFEKLVRSLISRWKTGTGVEYPNAGPDR